MLKYWFILVIMVVGGALTYYVVSDSYPVAFVNSEPISARFFNESRNVATHYYQKLYEIYKKDAGVLNDEASIKEINRAVLDKLIEDSLIEQELEKRIPRSELAVLIQNKISEAISEKNVKQGVEMLYGVSLRDFSLSTLRPIAAREILEDRLALENANFNAWLAKTKKEASVTLLLGKFSWDSIKGIISK